MDSFWCHLCVWRGGGMNSPCVRCCVCVCVCMWVSIGARWRYVYLGLWGSFKLSLRESGARFDMRIREHLLCTAGLCSCRILSAACKMEKKKNFFSSVSSAVHWERPSGERGTRNAINMFRWSQWSNFLPLTFSTPCIMYLNLIWRLCS